MLKIGDRLRLERLRLGMNQADFAALAGVTKTSQFNYEKGDRSPDANYLAALRPHGVDIHFVVTGEALPVTESALSSLEAELLGYFPRDVGRQPGCGAAHGLRHGGGRRRPGCGAVSYRA
ncbi:transcriptional regulator with XRE-family HTH domain [Pseudomonas psychrotolerans]|nr:transcriptional regulator with XRE-family HTH domain [Pseudomonas psychrotolerans]